MPDPKPTHPVARAIWEALSLSAPETLMTTFEILDHCDDRGHDRNSKLYRRLIAREVEKWDRVAREAEAASRPLTMPERMIAIDDRIIGPGYWTPPDESAHRREGGES